MVVTNKERKKERNDHNNTEHIRNSFTCKKFREAINFYQNKLGLTLARKLSKRRVAFFWVGENKQQMLGLWEVHNIEDFEPRHFAFGVNLEFLMTSKAWLEERGIAVIGSQGKGNQSQLSKGGCLLQVYTF